MSEASPPPTTTVSITTEKSDLGTNTSTTVQDDVLLAKEKFIETACRQHDVPTIIKLATSQGGLLRDELRRKAWPILIGSDNEDPPEGLDPSDHWQKLPSHRDEEQVHLDVDRAFVYYPSESEKQIQARKSMLAEVIVRVLRQHQMLCYFQGYHDIVQVLLLVLGEALAGPAAARISLLRIRDYMLPSLAPSVRHLQIIPALLASADPELAQRLAHTRPFFALAATLTLYAHDMQEYSDISRLYDFLLAHEPVMAIYMFTAIVRSRREELFDVPLEEPEMLHFVLSKLPQPLDLEGLIHSALELFNRYPPEALSKGVWSRISPNSVLKTARHSTVKQSLRQGEEFFSKQADELRRGEFRKSVMHAAWKYRGPASALTVALMVGFGSVWLNRSGHDRMAWGFVSRLLGRSSA